MGEGGFLKLLTKAVVVRALEGEMTDHLSYSKYSPIGKNTSNSLNGKTSKTIQGKNGKMEITVPRDRDGELEPQLIPKHHRRLSMKPGITGLWQVSGRNTIQNFDDWVKLDLEYIDNWSFLMDFRIAVKTVSTVFAGTGM